MTVTDGLGDRLRKLRVERGLAQSDLAREGLSASYVSLIEAGKRAPTVRALQQLAEALDTSVEYLRDGLDATFGDECRLRLDWAELALRNGNADEAVRTLGPVLAARTLDVASNWRARYLHAQSHEALGDLEAAILEFETLRKTAEADPARWPWLSVVVALCRCYREAGDLNYSISLAESVLGRVHELGLHGSDEHVEVAATLIGSYYERGDLSRARHLADELIRTTADGSPRAKGAAYWNASVVAHEQGRVGEALDLAGKAMTCMAKTANKRSYARLRLAYAALLLRQEPPAPEEALALLREATAALQDEGSLIDLSYADTESARAYLQLGDPIEAVRLSQAALHRLGDRPRLETARALAVLGQALNATGDAAGAVSRLRHAAQLLELVEASKDAAPVWHELADVLDDIGSPEEAIRAYRRSLAAAGVQPVKIARHAPAEST
jgi:transcriptional regulator with XRE-family HTH domain